MEGAFFSFEAMARSRVPGPSKQKSETTKTYSVAAGRRARASTSPASQRLGGGPFSSLVPVRVIPQFPMLAHRLLKEALMLSSHEAPFHSSSGAHQVLP